MGNGLSTIVNAITDTPTRKSIIGLGLKVEALDKTLSTIRRNNLNTLSHADLTDLDYASSGHTGFASSAALTAHTGNTSNPHSVTLQQAIAAGATASSVPVFNGGIDLGTSGRVDSNVTTGVAGHIGILYKPSVAYVAGEFVHSFQDSAGNVLLTYKGDGSWEFNGSDTSGGYISVGHTISQAAGINFSPFFSGAGGTALLNANTIVAGNFQAGLPSTVVATNYVGGMFTNNNPTFAASQTIPSAWGGWFCANAAATANSTTTWTVSGGWKVFGIRGTKNAGTATTWYGGYIENACTGTSPTITNDYGLYVEEQTRGGTIKNGIFLANATSGYKAIAIRDQNTWIGSSAAATLDLQATTVLVTADHKLSTAGNGYYVKEGSNATMGTATLSGGAATVNTTKVTANSRILLTTQSLGTVATPKEVAVTARTGGTSFTITSADATDTSVVAWLIMEPA